MSTASYLEQSVEFMKELGIYTQKQADSVEHCVDDAVNALDDLTDFIAKNPEVVALIKRIANTPKNLLDENEYTFVGRKEFVGSFILPSLDDHIYTLGENSPADVQDLFLSSASIGIKKVLIGAVTDGKTYFVKNDIVDSLNEKYNHGDPA